MVTLIYDPVLGAKYIFNPIKENRSQRRRKRK